MSQDDPFFAIPLALVTAYLFYTWWGDLQAAKYGKWVPNPYPGAYPCEKRAIAIAIAGAMVLLGVETLGENALGISEQQSNITALFLVPMICAAFYEELVFRGYLVVTRRGFRKLVASVFGFSLLFALAHPFLWDWKSPGVGEARTLVFDFSLKAWWSTSMVLVFSIWQYLSRFGKWNITQSLLPCFLGHLAKNIGVFLIKLAQGHVTGFW